MNTKTILLLTSLVNLSSLHADTTKPDPETLFESLYTDASRSAQKLKDGLCNLDPIHAGIALLATLAANQAANHMVYKRAQTALATLAAAVLATQEAQTNAEKAQRKQIEEQKAQEAQTALAAVLLKELSTKTFSFAAWLNIYNTMQRQAGKKTIELPLFSYIDFSACLANETWSVSLNLADSWDYLCSCFQFNY